MNKIKTTQHTPGPWVVIGEQVYAPDDCDHHPVADCTTNHSCRDEWDVEANARLIAAAPDLLEALQHIQRCIPLGGFAQIHHKSDTWAQIDAAIAKATGETNDN